MKDPYSTKSKVIAILRSLVWIGCLAWSSLVAMLYILFLLKTRGSNAITEISVTSMALFFLILGYVGSRSIDSILKVIE